jgi:alpha-ketoglutarate-dependent taurine dioxygenase
MKRPSLIADGYGRKAIKLSSEQLVEVSCLQPGQTLPLLIRPTVGSVNLAVWAANNYDFLEEKLLAHGAILFRGFGMNSVEKFEQFAAAASLSVMEYKERSSPRTQVADKVYTSTDYPADQDIFPHNEHSYAETFPRKLFFNCLTPATSGGATPLADTRKVLRRIAPATRERFMEKRWMYVRNFGDGFGLRWETVFQTSDRKEVERYCHSRKMEFQWKAGNGLRTKQVRPAIARHPRTGEAVWFNHATFFHITTLAPALRDGLLAEFEEQDLPNNTYYGDGSPIEAAVLDELREAYLQEMVYFPWQKGDLVLLDNMLTAHARTSYTGPRQVLFAMSDPITRDDI